MGFVTCTFFSVYRVGLLHPDRRQIAFFVSGRKFYGQAFKALQGEVLELLLELVGRDIPVSHEDGVTGVVVCLVETLELSITEIRDMSRLTTAVVVVGAGREQIAGDGLPQASRGRAHGTFHFIKYNALVLQITIRVAVFCKCQSMAFLGKVQFVKIREKHCIHINLQQVVKVFSVFACKWVGGAVTAGEGVHEGIE